MAAEQGRHRPANQLRVGVTGHMNLAEECLQSVAGAVRTLLGELVAQRPDTTLTGVTCLAPGADQLFAEVVLALGGQVEVVLPASDYRERLKPHQVADYDRLLADAAVVSVLPFLQSSRQAYLAASERVVASVDGLVAIWDGERSGGIGGTADVVAHTRSMGVPVYVVWPEGASRR
ncbi:hypothetical protein F0L68_15445 [Solihabitans fulvus]|uniref:DNA recombination-mediator protein A n=1 Tax=Solihabitans fulvus TaxID=1892852 RepID=A0A5B2XFV2_9PSEU|nr:hypothetical protein [Solihabitans fulvus]KAA2261800.1 hypothetical protein F0L68_15445 [Solihabitans fulvus]